MTQCAQCTAMRQLAVLGLLALIIALISLFFATSSVDYGQDQAQSFEELGGDFTLESATGTVSLSYFKGKAVLLYFGFLHCPDICPSSLLVIANALQQLSPKQLDSVQVLLVSVDHQRDTAAHVDEYAKYFHPRIIGLTDTKERIDKVVKQYGAYYKIDEDISAENGFGVEHTTRYYMINKQGELVAALRASSTANELRAKLLELI